MCCCFDRDEWESLQIKYVNLSLMREGLVVGIGNLWSSQGSFINNIQISRKNIFNWKFCGKWDNRKEYNEEKELENRATPKSFESRSPCSSKQFVINFPLKFFPIKLFSPRPGQNKSLRPSVWNFAHYNLFLCP